MLWLPPLLPLWLTLDLIVIGLIAYALVKMSNHHQQALKCSLLAIGCILLWEHFGRSNGVTWRPSLALTVMGDKMWDFFGWLGRGFAHLSSFLKYLHLEDIWTTVHDLAKPTVVILGSWVALFNDYLSTALTYATPSIVLVGSSLLVCTAAYFISRTAFADNLVTQVQQKVSWWHVTVLLALGLLAYGLKFQMPVEWAKILD